MDESLLNFVLARRLLSTLDLLKIDDVAKTKVGMRAYLTEACDLCDAFLQKRDNAHAAPARPWSDALLEQVAPSPRRALRPLRRILVDVFGPVSVKSMRHGYVYLVGLCDEATGM